MLVPGQIVDRYIVEDVLGEGGMATVYRVRHATLGSLHALKLLKVQAPSIRARLLAEGRAQAGLRHPNLVPVTDVVEVQGSPALILDYVDGPTLEGWIHSRRPALPEAERIFRGILAGVARAHRTGIVHRDLKPGNVLLEQGDDGVVPRVTDFGLAKALSEDVGGVGMTRAGTSMGTPQFMSPEQIRNAAGVDQRADIWALGCILYELVGGVRAFDGGEDVFETFSVVTAGRYIPVEQRVPGVPDRIRLAIEGSLQVDREKRIPTCAALRQALAGSGTPRPRTGSPTPAPMPSLGEYLVEDVQGVGRWSLPAEEEDGELAVNPSIGEVVLGEPDEPRSDARRPAARSVASMAPQETQEKGPLRSPGTLQRTWFQDAARPTQPAEHGAWRWVAGGAMVFAGAGVLALGVGVVWWETMRSPPLEPAPEAAAVLAEPEPAETVATAQPGNGASGSSVHEPAALPPSAPTPSTTANPPRSLRTSSSPATATAAAAPAPKPATTRPETGTVTIAGPVEGMVLVGPNGRVGPGVVPAGVYEIRAAFPGHEEAVAGHVTIQAGDALTLRCDEAFQICREVTP